MCFTASLNPPMPQVDYGQGKQAFNPSERGPVYQQIEKARQDAAFAQSFAADIMLGKEASGSKVYGKNGQSMAGNKNGYLYNKNTLNAASSWVPQTFGAPAVQDKEGNWYQANLLANGNVIKADNSRLVQDNRGTFQVDTFIKQGDGYGFIPGTKITDANMVRLLNEGHYAFSAKGFDGSQVYVPWASGYTPKKGYAGKPEAGNYKKDQDPKKVHTESAGVGVGQAQPGNVLGGKPTLLGDAGKKQIGKTLLGA